MSAGRNFLSILMLKCVSFLLKKNRYTLQAEKVRSLIDENRICVGVILGSTYTGDIDPVCGLN